jgi:error-prone DNA polymerase
VRVAARGSGAGSLVNHLLGISGVDPLRYGLLMERFFTAIRVQLPDIDIDVEAARRTEVYEEILTAFGGERVTCVSMMDTYRVRHAIRDAGAALGLPPGEIDSIAKAFPHIRARDVRHAVAELPELRATGLGESRLGLLFDLVERLDGLPRHIALHPCGVVLSDSGLLGRTPVEASWMGFPMSQFDKDDVEAMGLLKLDVLGIRMQSAMAYAVDEVIRVDGARAAQAGNHPPGAAYLDETGRIDLDAVPLDDDTTFAMIRTAHTLGCFQIESPGQRELVGKFGPETFYDLIIDISLFRPGPVKSDMIAPFLRARQGWDQPEYVHPRLKEALEDTHGVVVFHEQVLKIIDLTTGCGLEHADEVRRAMGSPQGQDKVKAWLVPEARRMGFDQASIDRIWAVLKAFASFGFCKAHAAAFALPTYQSAWLKAHHPAAFLAGVLTHDPGMYPKRLILDDARNLGITVLGLDVNRSEGSYRVELLEPDSHHAPSQQVPRPEPDLPDGRPYGIRLSLADVKGISEAEVERVVAGRPYQSLADFWHRAQVTRPVAERLVLTGAFDRMYSIGNGTGVPIRGRVTRRDLLLQLGELERWSTSAASAAGRSSSRSRAVPADLGGIGGGLQGGISGGVRAAAGRQSRAARPVVRADQLATQLTLDLGDAPDEIILSGLPEMSGAERVRAELDVLGLDASRHVLDFYVPLLDTLGVVRARDVLAHRSRSELLIAGVKVATQTPPIRTGRRVVFLTLDDATGPVDATFFEDAQGPYAATVFHSWLLVVRGVLRRTGPRGVSLRATGAWELPLLWEAWNSRGLDAVRALITAAPDLTGAGWRTPRTPSGLPAAAYDHGALMPAAAGQSAPGRIQGTSRDDGALPGPAGGNEWEIATGLPSGDRLPATASLPPHRSAKEGRPAGKSSPAGEGRSAGEGRPVEDEGRERSGGMGGGHRRVLVHPSGFRQSPYADLKPPGADTRETRRMLAAEEEAAREHQERRRYDPPRKLWHSSPGSSGH